MHLRHMKTRELHFSNDSSLSTTKNALQALKILADDVQCDVIKIGGIIRNKVNLCVTVGLKC